MPNKITAILVDDEVSARNILTSLLEKYCPHIELLGAYANVEEAVKGIEIHHPQVVFLDIEMPRYAGYEIVDFFESIPFEIIFVTAYDQYAIKAFEIAAVDYLLKPIEVARLKKAAQKLDDQLLIKKDKAHLGLLVKTLKTNEVSQITVMEKGFRQLIDVDQIIAFEAQESYSKMYTHGGETFMISKNLKHFEGLLEGDARFFRTHKSWIVNIDYMINYSKSKLEINLESGLLAKLSKYKKTEFEALLQ